MNLYYSCNKLELILFDECSRDMYYEQLKHMEFLNVIVVNLTRIAFDEEGCYFCIFVLVMVLYSFICSQYFSPPPFHLFQERHRYAVLFVQHVCCIYPWSTLYCLLSSAYCWWSEDLHLQVFWNHALYIKNVVYTKIFRKFS